MDKYGRLKADMTEPERDYYRSLCAFTPDELAVFNMRTSGKSIVETAIALGTSTSTVSRRTRRIREKMERV